MKEVKKMDILSVANMQALMVVVILVGLALLAIPIVLIVSAFAGAKALVAIPVILLIAFFVIIIYGAVSWLAGVLTTAIYNWLAKKIGGIQIEFAEEQPSALQEQSVTEVKEAHVEEEIKPQVVKKLASKKKKAVK